MIDNKIINELLGIKESYQATDRLKKILSSKEERENIFDEFLKKEQDLSFDWFTDYFQTEHGDRSKLKQDYTPDCVCKLINMLLAKEDNLIDVCSGTGGLTISNWNNNQNKQFYCEEYSERAFYFLLFNMVIRGMNGIAVNCDCLTKETKAIYILKNAGKYSDLELVEELPDYSTKCVIMNPPYSMSWNADNFKNDKRFIDYGIAPKSKSDYAFVLHGLYKLQDGGQLLSILPHGILFRGQQEEKIREALIKNNLIDAVIGLPNNLFLNTGIPVCFFILKKNRQYKDILFIDASRDFIKGKNQNLLSEEQIKKIVDTYKNRNEVEKYSHLATLEEIEENGYNLNIPRFVDTFEEEEIEPLDVIVKKLVETQKEIEESNKSLLEMMKELTANDEETAKELETAVNGLEEAIKINQSKQFYEDTDIFIEYMKDKKSKTVVLNEFATIERATKGKIYEKGAVLISMSATSGAVERLQETGEVNEKYAVIQAKKKSNADFLHIALLKHFPSYFLKTKQGMNYPIDELGKLKIKVFDDDVNVIVSTYFERLDKYMSGVQSSIDIWVLGKSYFLSKMFVGNTESTKKQHKLAVADIKPQENQLELF